MTQHSPLDDIRRRLDSLRREIDALARLDRLGSGGRLTGGGTVATGGFDFTVPESGTASMYGVVSGARVYNSADISTSDSSPTTLTFNSERFDTHDYHGTISPSRLTAPVDGTYFICANVIFYGNATGTRTGLVQVNGGTVICGMMVDVDDTSTPYMNMPTVYQLEAGDYAEVIVSQSSGTALSVRSLSAFSPEFSMVLLSS